MRNYIFKPESFSDKNNSTEVDTFIAYFELQIVCSTIKFYNSDRKTNYVGLFEKHKCINMSWEQEQRTMKSQFYE